MRALGIVIAIIGVVVLLGGAGMDTTRTAQSCVEYQSSYGNGYSCTEYQYSDPGPKIAAMSLGFAMLVGGVVLARRSGGTDGKKQPAGIDSSGEFESLRTTDEGVDERPPRENADRDGGSNDRTGHSFAAQLEERRNEE